MEWLTTDLMAAAGPYMGTALMCLMFQGAVVWKVQNKRLRLVATSALLIIASAALIVGLVVAAKQDFNL